MTANKSSDSKKAEKLTTEPDDFLDLTPPKVPPLMVNVLHVFAKNIPEDARKQCAIRDGETSIPYPEDGSEAERTHHLLAFVRERLYVISRLECARWLNGRLPFITPRELIIWRLRQYVWYIWAFQLPDNDDLAMILNTTKMRAGHIAADFLARFRKSLLFPIALRRIYRILRGEDAYNHIVDQEVEYKKAYGSTFRVPSKRYVQDTNALIDEFRLRLREEGFLRDAALYSKEEDIMWVSERVIEVAGYDDIRQELLDLYKTEGEPGYEG